MTEQSNLKNAQQNQPNDSLGAVILIFAGVVFLLNNFNIIPWGFWESLIRYWPLLLILMGLRLLLGNNWKSNLLLTLLGTLFLLLFLLVYLSAFNPPFETWLKSILPAFNPQDLSFLIY